MLSVTNEYKLMSQIPKPKPVEASKNATDMPSKVGEDGMPPKGTQNFKMGDFSQDGVDGKEEIDRLINNADGIEELKELLVKF